MRKECTAREWAELGLPGPDSTVGNAANFGLSKVAAGCCTVAGRTAVVDCTVVGYCTAVGCTVGYCTVADYIVADSGSSVGSGCCCCSTGWHSPSAVGSVAGYAGFVGVDFVVAVVDAVGASAGPCAWAEVASSREDCWLLPLLHTHHTRTREDGRRASS